MPEASNPAVLSVGGQCVSSVKGRRVLESTSVLFGTFTG